MHLLVVYFFQFWLNHEKRISKQLKGIFCSSHFEIIHESVLHAYQKGILLMLEVLLILDLDAALHNGYLSR